MNDNQNTNGWRTLARATRDGILLAAYPYPGGYNAFPLAWWQIDTPPKLLGCVRELCDKAWFSPEMCADLIDAAADRFDWDIEGEL